MYYADKLESLKEIFGTPAVKLWPGFIEVNDKKYPVVDDVVILSDPSQFTPHVKSKLSGVGGKDLQQPDSAFAEDIQYTFGEEWQEYDKVLPEHQKEFNQYFDIANLQNLENKRVCDLGCGNGRWSYFISGACREVVLVDFSDAVFVARKNLSSSKNTLFFMCDIKKLPFKNDFCDFLFCLGVLHHLPTPCLDEVRNLKKYAPSLLVFLYYSLDNRPFYFRLILSAVTVARALLSRVRSVLFRRAFTLAGTYLIYKPMVLLGKAFKPAGLASYVPLYDAYHIMSTERIKQDVYDRFFTRIEQRVSRKDIMTLKDTFTDVTISDYLPYHHFLCKR